MSGSPIETMILTEGYHDRAFWSGWLLHLACADPGQVPGSNARKPVFDPWGTKVTKGHYAYHSKSGHFLRVVPCNSRSRVVPEAIDRLGERGFHPLRALVLNVDPDVEAKDGGTADLGIQAHDVLHQLQKTDASATQNVEGDIEIDGGATKVFLIRWEGDDPPTAGVPAPQTLERLVCACLAAAYPKRAEAVETWLRSRLDPPAPNPKEYTWSYLAGWSAARGVDYWWASVWNDDAVRSELERRLRATGAWRIVEAITNYP